MEKTIIDAGRRIIKERDEAHEKMEMYIEGSNQYRFWRGRWEARCAELMGYKKALEKMGREDLSSMIGG